MSDVLKVVLEIIAGIGGVSAIFTAVVAFSSSIIADKLQQKYQLKMNEELEKYKAGLSNKVYISKAKFDAEFDIYKHLSEKFSVCVKRFSIMIPQGLTSVPADEEQRKKQDEENYRNACNAYANAQDELFKSIPFIPENIADEYSELLKLCSLQLYDFEERWSISFLGTKEEKSTLSMESYKRTGEINDKLKGINHVIRDYLGKIDVL